MQRYFALPLSGWRWLLSALLLTGIGSGQAAEGIPSGPGRSPFLPPGWEAKNNAPEQAPRVTTASASQRGQYVFNGLLHIGDDIYISIHDKKSGWSHLITPGEDSEGIIIDRFNQEQGSIVLVHNGIREELTLVKADGLPIGQSAPAAAQASTSRSAAYVPPQWLEARERRRDEMLERRRQIEELRRGRSR